MICMALIFVCLIGYWKSESLLMVTIFAAIVGCLIYVPQFLASVQTMEIVPSFAVGSAVGLRGFMSYIFGASLGTSLFGVMVDKMGWHGGFYLLMGVLFAASCSATSLIAVRWNLNNSEKMLNKKKHHSSWRMPGNSFRSHKKVPAMLALQ